MRNLLAILLMSPFCSSLFGQNNLDIYAKADSLYQLERYVEALPLYKRLESSIDKKDTLYTYVLWYYGTTLGQIERSYAKDMDWENTLKYAIEYEAVIERADGILREDYQDRKFWLYKDFIRAYYGLDKPEKADPYRNKLYKAHKSKTLPEGIHHNFNFENFVLDNKNIWGYEWYPELGDPETQGSFAKVVYYIYSRTGDGEDKEQLYNLSVLKFHKIDPKTKFDYVLTKRIATATEETGGTLYSYTYDKNLDYEKLHSDIIEVVKGNLEPDTKNRSKRN
jgi:hypothetical protein